MTDQTTVDPEPPTEPEATPAAPERPALSPLAADVLRHANRVHGLLKRLDRLDLAHRIRHEADRWKDDQTNIVITGDIKRGKSSLINALIGAPGLLPVDADVATAVHLLVRYAPELTVTVTRQVGDDAETFPIDPAQLLDYASMRGDPALREGVLRVDVGVPHPLLQRGITLVDTPGVGGMTRGHKDITLATLGMADALLFTVSAQEPILRSELEFLVEASQRIDSVLFLLTKSDATPDAGAMIEENREKIRAFVATIRSNSAEGDETAEQVVERLERLRWAPFVPLSAKLAEGAQARMAAGRAERAAELQERSGIPRLEQFLEATLASREHVRLSNILQVADVALASVEDEQSARIRAAQGDASLEEDLRREQAALEALANRQARWRQKLAQRVQFLQGELNQAVGREQSRMERTYREWLDAAGKNVQPLLEGLPVSLSATVQACWADLSRMLAAGMEAALAEVVRDFELSDLNLVMADLLMPERVVDIADARQAMANAKGFDLAEDGVPGIMQSFIFGNIGGLLLGGLAAGPAMLLGAPLSLGVVMLRKRVKMRQISKNEYLRVVREAAAAFGQEFRGESALRITEAKASVEELVDERVRARRAAAEASRKELANLVKQETASRQRVEKETKATLDTIAELRAGIDKHREQVYAALERT